MKYFKITTETTSTGEVSYLVKSKRKWYHLSWTLHGVYANHKTAAQVLEKLLSEPLIK